MPRFSILHATRGGQTEKIARRIAKTLREAGHEATVENVGKAAGAVDLASRDAVILGAPVYGGKHPRPAVGFVKGHLEVLNAKPSFFFSVSLSAAGKSGRQQENARRCLDQFLQAAGWRPRCTATVAGALLYRDYNFLLRWLMKRIARKEGGDTDTSRNHEYTDWEAVDAFARDCAQQTAAAKSR